MLGGDGATGFFGKVASHGDFVARRFDPALRQLVDGWLQRSIEHSRRSLGPPWQSAFETMPVWRFVLTPGLSGQSGFAGLMISSTDRVGRHFPLLVAARLPMPPSQLHAAQNMQLWFDAAERLLLSVRQSGFDLDRFDEALAALPMPPKGDGEIMKGRSFWWTGGGGVSRRFSATGLPAPENFARFLGETAASPSVPPQEPLPPPRPAEKRPALVLNAAGASHSGTRPRTDTMVMTNGQRCDLHALARGFSHSVAGAQAASLVVERLLRITPALTIAELAAYAKGALRSADSLLRGRGRGSGVASEVSVVALVTAGTRWAVVWAGDLRCYLLHDGLTRCLTRDPVEVGLRRRPARTVGGPAQFACDIVTGDLSVGDRFLLVAADLARLVGERKIAAHLAEPRLADIPTAVIEEALLSGVGGSVGAVAIAATSPPNGDIP